MSFQTLFSSGPQLANLAVNLEPIHHALVSIVDLYRKVNLNNQGSLIKVKVTRLPRNLTVLTFATPSISTSNQELVSWTLFKDIVPHFEFLCSPFKPNFSIDKTVIDMFASALDLLDQLKNQNSIAHMAKFAKEAIIQRRDFFDPSKRLNNVKINMTQLEWYKKKAKKEEIGYYDSYKNGKAEREKDVRKFKCGLQIYWYKIVEELEKNPQKEGEALRIRWIFSGTRYRRMIEPLDIAEFYQRNSHESYFESRPNHYILLEKWFELEEKNKDQRYDRREPIGMTNDSCFWAHVEEAMKSCRLWNSGGLSNEERQETTQSLHDFEEYLMGLIKAYAVSSEVFLKESSLMKWWNEYEKINGTRYSEFVEFMKNHKYREYV